MSPKARRQLDTSALLPSPTDSSDETTLGSLLDNRHPSIRTADFAPKRPILHDSRVTVFISHAGASSTNEAVVAGIPVITLPAYFDQIQNAMRLRDAGVSVPLQKETLSASDVTAAITRILDDIRTDGPIMANVRRVCGIARIAAHRKHLAVDLIEEVLIDWQGRQRERRLVGSGTTPGNALGDCRGTDAEVEGEELGPFRVDGVTWFISCCDCHGSFFLNIGIDGIVVLERTRSMVYFFGHIFK